MKTLMHLLLSFCIVFTSCNSTPKEDPVEKWKNEIVAVEKEFAEMALKEGIPKAFLTFAADDVVLMRNNRLITGKAALAKTYENDESDVKDESLTWKPDFVDVASSGDLGYTYGKYQYTYTDSTGNTRVTEGIFHTVWKRQPDGAWRYVWD